MQESFRFDRLVHHGGMMLVVLSLSEEAVLKTIIIFLSYEMNKEEVMFKY